jgi:hypothetical protein
LEEGLSIARRLEAYERTAISKDSVKKLAKRARIIIDMLEKYEPVDWIVSFRLRKTDEQTFSDKH